MELVKETPPPALAEYGIEFFIISRAESGFTARKHMHPAVEFIYFHDGEFKIETESECVNAHSGDLILFRSNTVHVIEKMNTGTGSYHVLKASPTFLFSMFQRNSIENILPLLKNRSGDTCFYPASSLSEDIKDIWTSMICEYNKNEPTFFAMQRFLACEFILKFSRYLPKKEGSLSMSSLNEHSVRLISDSVNYINENYSLPLSAVGCANLANLSYSYYAKLFHAVIGMSFKEYLTELRMVKAYNMLLSSDLSVSDVAMSCGYENFSHFIAEFKKRYSKTPGQFRKAIHNSTQPHITPN